MEAIIIVQDGLTAIKFFLHKAGQDYWPSTKVTNDNPTMRTGERQGFFNFRGQAHRANFANPVCNTRWFRNPGFTLDPDQG
jgi:hypothetical protein